MVIEIDERQRDALRALVETRLGSLSGEIRHTDTPRVREHLRSERETLREVQSKLAPQPAEI